MTDTPAGPIILIGAARSGTKFLRDVLGAGDGVKLVPYDINYVWRYGIKNNPHDMLDPNTLTSGQIAFIKKTIRKLAKARPNDILVEKTVSNTLRVLYVEKIFPNARYIHLIRDGRDVTESAMRQWQAPPDWNALITKLRGMPLSNIGYVTWFIKNFVTGLTSGRKGGAIWGPRFPGIGGIANEKPLIETCALQWKHSVETASQDLAHIPATRVFKIRYEDLIAEKTAIIKLVDQLRLPNAKDVLAAWAASVSPSKSKKWQKLTVADQTLMISTIGETLKTMGYQD